MSYQKHIGITVPIPVRYYMLGMHLTEEASQEEHGMISFDSCCSIGLNLEIVRNDVLKSIIYLHSMASFLFFPKVLPNVIFTNPQYLLDMLSALIRFSFVESLEDILPVNQCIEVDAKQIFHEDGVFDSSLLGKLCLPLLLLCFQKRSFLNCLDISVSLLLFLQTKPKSNTLCQSCYHHVISLKKIQVYLECHVIQ